MFRTLVILGAMLFAAPLVHAQVDIADPWVRATVPGQKATGAFMKITSFADVRLIRVRSPLAGRAEIHEMAMDGDQMKMRAVPWLPILVNAPVELKPGSYHMMLFDLKAQIKEGDTVPLTLVFENRYAAVQTVEVDAQARALAAPVRH
ncbi:MAG: copper chaperone PCu(A)C [Azoarcus sp.]|nr:copper chaperone PCu(A)C [Azoarcus sp.]